MSRTPWLVPLAVGASLVAVGAAWRSRWRATMLWGGLGVVGYAASLELVSAGPTVRYQHYLPPAAWWQTQPLALLVLGAEVLAVALGLLSQRDRLGALTRHRRPAQLVLAGLVFGLTSATLSARIPVYGLELVVATLIQATHLGAAVLAGLALPADRAADLDRRVDEWLGPEAAEPGRPRIDRFALACAGLAAAVPALLVLISYQAFPHVPDEVVYLLHARYFADGRLALPVPHPYQAFDIDLMFPFGSHWASPVPPGWPAILAVGVKLGAPWLVNPVLNGINVLLFFLLLGHLYDRRTARVGALLFALSPWNLYLAMSLLTHSASLAFALAAALGVARVKEGGSVGLALAAGMAIGVVSLIRPLEGLALAILLGLWILGTRPWRRALAGGALLATATVLIGAITFPYNGYLTGSPKRFPLMVYSDSLYGAGSNDLGFGPNRGLGWSGLDPFPGHGLRDVLVNANLNFFALNVELLGWSVGSLLVIALLGFGGRLRSGDRLLIAVALTIVGLHSFYWFAGGPDFGPRYWYFCVVPGIGLAARGLQALAPATAGRDTRGRILASAAILVVGSALVFVPWRAGDKYRGYRGMTPGLRTLAATTPLGRSLVLVRGKRHPDYAAASVLNPLDLHADGPIFAWDRDSTVRQQVLEAYRDRTVWIVDGPSVSGDGYRIVEGPVPAERLLNPSPAPAQ